MRGAGHDQMHQIVQRQQAAAVVDSAQRQGQTALQRAQQAREIGLDARAVDQGRSDDDQLHASLRGNRAQTLLGLPFGHRIGVLRRRHIGGRERPARDRGLAVHLDGAEENETPHPLRRRLPRQLQGPVHVDTAVLRQRRVAPVRHRMHARGQMHQHRHTVQRQRAVGHQQAMAHTGGKRLRRTRHGRYRKAAALRLRAQGASDKTVRTGHPHLLSVHAPRLPSTLHTRQKAKKNHWSRRRRRQRRA